MQDGDFSEDRFQKIVNAFLANDVGNCLNRTLGLLHKFCNGQIPLSSAGTSSFTSDLFFLDPYNNYSS